MQMLLFKTGKSFRAIVLAQSLQPYQYGAVIQDIIRESQEIKPALRDLSARRQFQELPLKGSISQKRLAKYQLLSELRPLYRDDILADLEHFIEGVLDLEEKDANGLEGNADQAKENKVLLDFLPKRFDPRIPMGRKSYFLTSIVTTLSVLLVGLGSMALFILVFGESAPDYLTVESVPYPYWMAFFFLPFSLPLHLLDFRRAKAASIHSSWVWILIVLTVIDSFVSLNQSDFFSPISKVQGLIYFPFIFKSNKVQVPWPRESGVSNASLLTGLHPKEQRDNES